MKKHPFSEPNYSSVGLWIPSRTSWRVGVRSGGNTIRWWWRAIHRGPTTTVLTQVSHMNLQFDYQLQPHHAHTEIRGFLHGSNCAVEALTKTFRYSKTNRNNFRCNRGEEEILPDPSTRKETADFGGVIQNQHTRTGCALVPSSLPLYEDDGWKENREHWHSGPE